MYRINALDYDQSRGWGSRGTRNLEEEQTAGNGGVEVESHVCVLEAITALWTWLIAGQAALLFLQHNDMFVRQLRPLLSTHCFFHQLQN